MTIKSKSTADGKLSCAEFGRRLLELNDLDPVYVLLWEAKLPQSVLRRWLLAYCCFYHVGTASWVASAPTDYDITYWGRFQVAAGSKEYPRCHERRHFRGAKAEQAVRALSADGVDGFWEALNFGAWEEKGGVPVRVVTERVQRFSQFGPWIAFKVADMLERLGLVNVEFDSDTALYDGSPTDGAKLLWETSGKPGLNGTAVTEWAAEQVLSELGGYKAPPRYERPLGLQEVETVLCKWHSYVKGHYHLGEDVEGCRGGLLRFARCSLSQELLRAGRRAELWK